MHQSIPVFFYEADVISINNTFNIPAFICNFPSMYIDQTTQKDY